MKKIISFLIILMFVSISCSNEVEPNDITDEIKIIIDGELYNSAPNDTFSIKEIKITNDILKIVIEYGGGCGDVEAKLIDAGVVMESNPVQRNIRLSFKDHDFCKALIEKEYSFDIKSIQVIGDNRVFLNIKDWNNKRILYTY